VVMCQTMYGRDRWNMYEATSRNNPLTFIHRDYHHPMNVLWAIKVSGVICGLGETLALAHEGVDVGHYSD